MCPHIESPITPVPIHPMRAFAETAEMSLDPAGITTSFGFRESVEALQ
jgi:hypothetical protein